MNKVLAADQNYHLSLRKMAKAAKKDEVIFKHLAEPLANGIISIPQAWPDTNAILIFCTMGATVLALVIGICAFLKLRKLSMALIVLQQVTNVKSQTAPSFVYESVRSTPKVEPISIEQATFNMVYSITKSKLCNMKHNLQVLRFFDP